MRVSMVQVIHVMSHLSCADGVQPYDLPNDKCEVTNTTESFVPEDHPCDVCGRTIAEGRRFTRQTLKFTQTVDYADMVGIR